jgi:signal transduction histidine kinase
MGTRHEGARESAATGPARGGGCRFGLVSVLKLLGVFSAVAVLVATQYYFSFGGQRPRSWTHFLLVTLPTWYTWALFAPLIFKATRRWPFDKASWASSALRHTGVIALVAPIRSALDICLSLLVLVVFEGKSWGIFSSFPWGDFVGFMAETPVTYAAIVGVASALEYQRKLRERDLAASRLEAALAEAHLRTLRSQLDPHFLFNTLNAIGALSRRDPEATNRMITLLCGLLRRSLDADGRQVVPLEEELDFVRDYLDIERARFPDRLRVSYDVPSDLLDQLVPSLVLQPLAENAVRHGISPRSTAGLVTVRARRDGNTLEMTVEDDGAGLPNGRAVEGHGLNLTRQRLRALYGCAAGVELQPRPEGGARATVRMPLPSKAAEKEGAS